jgi:hypothetical protein
VGSERGGEVDRSRPVERADDQVAQAGHHSWAGAGTGLRPVLGEGGREWRR